jgi:hypothetical protein
VLPQVKRPQDKYDLAALHNFRKPGCLWSKGIGEYCDFQGPDSYRLAATESCQPEEFFLRHYVGAHGLVWVRLSTQARAGLVCDLDNFVHAALPTINRPFALITTDGDASVPSELSRNTVSALLDNPYLVSWHTQNHDGHPHPKLKPFPIGLDFHTPRPETTPANLHEQLLFIRRDRRPAQELPLRVFCDFRDTPERREVLATLRSCDHIEFLSSRLAQADIWKRYAQYPFVVSAKSNGLDCHRTWELLYLGCIVITQTSPLDPLFSGLPVVIVRDWREVRRPENLTAWIAQFGELTDQSRVWAHLDPNRLLQPIRVALDAAGA